MISPTPTAARRSITVSIIGLPATVTIGLGTVSVIGRSRVPKPAASTMARVGTDERPAAFCAFDAANSLSRACCAGVSGMRAVRARSAASRPGVRRAAGGR